MTPRLVLLLSPLLLLGFAASANALTYPIPELDNCRDAKECALYCEIPAHKAACWSYATYSVATPAILGETTDTTITPTPTPKISFPIPELDNCASILECKAYCDDPTHFTRCTAVAKQRDLSRAATNYGQQTALLARAKELLGCASLPECRAYCNNPNNAEQCQELSTKYGSLRQRQDQQTLLERARTNLGCTSIAHCRAFCASDNNKAHCRTFAEQHSPSLRRAKTRHLQFTCTTKEECNAYCQDNPKNCPGFPQPSRPAPIFQDRPVTPAPTN